MSPIISGGGVAGGTTAGATIVRGPFTFAYNTAGINNGVTIYTPTVNDVLLDAWIEVTTGFNGTTPLADIGPYVAGFTFGFFSDGINFVDVSTADANSHGQGYMRSTSGDPSSLLQGVMSGFLPTAFLRYGPPFRFSVANPIKVVVSQTGQIGGAAVGGTAGAGAVYLVTATPTT